MFKGLMLAAAGAATLAALFVAGTASAQYPEPKGNLVCTTKVSVEAHETTFYATLRDSSGKPIAGKVVNFKVIGGTGTIDGSTDTTDANGVAWVRSKSSNISVAAIYDGIQCSAVSQILGSTFSPPSTGDAGLVGSGGTSAQSGVLAGALVVMGASGLGVVGLRHRRFARQI